MFKRVLIANRGEIAVRIIRACEELDIETVAIFSEADENALHVQLADHAVCVGGADATDSYLNKDSILRAALETGADAIHPGYGFLSEDADFAQQVTEHGITWIGPMPETIRLVGDKDVARASMQPSGIPMAKGSEPLKNNKEAVKAAKEVGYPVILKPVSGGGGKGMYVAHDEDELKDILDTLVDLKKINYYFEHYIERSRHIEVQIVADNYGEVIHLGERECSIQRRNQKLLEESPSIALTHEMRKQVGTLAVKAAKSVHYSNVGTVEFLLDLKDNQFYFMEINPRIQVEHGVTEEVTGIDIVRTQIRIAAGEPLDITQADVHFQGHAIECRINAEDPVQGFRPCPGRVDFLHFPGGPGVRVDSCLYSGCELSPYYDSMAAKILAYAPTRMETIRRMRRCLEEFTLEGFPTNAELSYQILYHPEFILGECTTAFLDEHLSELLEFSRKLSESGVDA